MFIDDRRPFLTLARAVAYSPLRGMSLAALKSLELTLTTTPWRPPLPTSAATAYQTARCAALSTAPFHFASRAAPFDPACRPWAARRRRASRAAARLGGGPI